MLILVHTRVRTGTYPRISIRRVFIFPDKFHLTTACTYLKFAEFSLRSAPRILHLYMRGRAFTRFASLRMFPYLIIRIHVYICLREFHSLIREFLEISEEKF